MRHKKTASIAQDRSIRSNAVSRDGDQYSPAPSSVFLNVGLGEADFIVLLGLGELPTTLLWRSILPGHYI
jgi:hypothetical protein